MRVQPPVAGSRASGPASVSVRQVRSIDFLYYHSVVRSRPGATKSQVTAALAVGHLVVCQWSVRLADIGQSLWPPGQAANSE